MPILAFLWAIGAHSSSDQLVKTLFHKVSREFQIPSELLYELPEQLPAYTTAGGSRYSSSFSIQRAQPPMYISDKICISILQKWGQQTHGIYS